MLTLLSPNGGETWEAGSIYPVTWQSNVDLGGVNIEYSVDNGVTWIPIFVSEVSNYKLQNTNYKQITNPKLQIAIEDIHGLHQGSFKLQSMNVLIKSFYGKWRVQGGQFFQKAPPLAAGGNSIESSYDWLVPDTPSESCLVRISGSNDIVISDSSDAVFSIVSPVNPLITVTYPNGGETLVVGNVHEITWDSYKRWGQVCYLS